jgi:tRNA G37 N-methylase Trm5
MVNNARANHCAAPFLTCYNLCGRELISRLLRSPATRRLDHVLMNLPQSATDFLDVFIGYNRKRDATDAESR